MTFPKIKKGFFYTLKDAKSLLFTPKRYDEHRPAHRHKGVLPWESKADQKLQAEDDHCMDNV